MDARNKISIGIDDLPNEMLLYILKKMNTIDALYSLVDVNQRLNKLLLDPLHIHNLNFTIRSLLNNTARIDCKVLNRVCKQILPRINSRIKKLIVEPIFMEDILSIVSYPQLNSLSLIDFEQETLLRYITGDTILVRLLTSQIMYLDIQIKGRITAEQSNIFSLILSLGKHLINLTFSQFFLDKHLTISIFNLPSTTCVSSTLIKLNIHVQTFDDCLFLLDGRLNCLSTLIITINKNFDPLSNIDNTKKLPKLKCFSLSSYCETWFYDSRIVQLLSRMENLEELTLFLIIMKRNSTYIDGNHLYNQVLVHMPRLNKFIFNIHNEVYNLDAQIDLPSTDDIQRSFIEKGIRQVGSFVGNNRTKIRGECHIYSLPYQFDVFYGLSNYYQGGMFNNVRKLIMIDTNPFEHEFFNRISNDFPFIQQLILTNSKAQTNKQDLFTLIKFSHLIDLDLSLTHVDYAKQFLFESKTFLTHLCRLTIQYKTLLIVTNNFTNDETRLNCSQLQILRITEPFVRSENFHAYFPSLCK